MVLRLCGARGVLLGPPLFACAAGHANPATVPSPIESPCRHPRIDTSDFCAYRDVLIFRSKSYDPRIPGFSPSTIVDVGAHIGMASILFALKYPTARIIALEPEPANFAALVRNTSAYKTITPIQAALWRRDGQATLGASNAHPKEPFR